MLETSLNPMCTKKISVWWSLAEFSFFQWIRNSCWLMSPQDIFENGTIWEYEFKKCWGFSLSETCLNPG